MGHVTSRGVGQYVASEAHSSLHNRFYHSDRSRRAVIFFPGGVGGDRKFIDDPVNGSQTALALSSAGFPLLSATFGGASKWGNSTTVTRIGQAWTYAQTLLGTKTDKLLLVGVSQGATAAFNWAKDNVSQVAAVVGLVPAVDIQDIHTNNRGGNTAAIEAAYGGSAPPDSSNPADNTETLSGLPIKIWYSTDDVVVDPPTITTFAQATGITAISLGAVGHTAETVPPGDVVSFLQGYAA